MPIDWFPLWLSLRVAALATLFSLALGLWLAWLLANPVVTAPIVGPRTLEQLDASLHSLDIRLEDDVLARLDQIFPGPGAAPEAYAW